MRAPPTKPRTIPKIWEFRGAAPEFRGWWWSPPEGVGSKPTHNPTHINPPRNSCILIGARRARALGKHGFHWPHYWRLRVLAPCSERSAADVELAGLEMLIQGVDEDFAGGKAARGLVITLVCI